MVASARRKLLGRARKAVFHCTARCVRRAFLCGLDPPSGEDYSHRRDWIVNREEQLAQLFTIEVEFRAELSNHLHVVLRTRPEIAARLRPREVAHRWLTITKLAKCMSDEMPEPDEKRIDKLVGNKKQIEKMRRRLSKISWFMGILLENIARRANFEDDCTGRFWATRFKCREITDESGLLLCGIYVDLNPIRAGEADSPETAQLHVCFPASRGPIAAQECPRSGRWLDGGTDIAPRAEGGRGTGVFLAERTSRLGSGIASHLVGRLRKVAQVDGPTAQEW